MSEGERIKVELRERGLLPLQEVACIVDVTDTAIRKWWKRGSFGMTLVDGCWFVHPDDVLRRKEQPELRKGRPRVFSISESQKRRKQAAKARNDRNYALKKAAVDAAKSVPCADCGQHYHPICMDFDHLDPNEKTSSVSRMRATGSLKAMLAEIAKCDVVCSNCHRLRTLERGQYRRSASLVPPHRGTGATG